jgi:hypothetical protein
MSAAARRYRAFKRHFMLNDCHLEFLGNFVHYDVMFLIIGGQARRCCGEQETRDLDIWVDLDRGVRTKLERALLHWSSDHPLYRHEGALTLSELQLLRPGVQIKFPDIDGCSYMNSGGQPATIDHADRVDGLTSAGEHEFGRVFARATRRTIDGVTLAFLSCDDTETVAPRLRRPSRTPAASPCGELGEYFMGRYGASRRSH